MQAVAIVVARQLDGLTANDDLSVLDAVGIAADSSTEVAGILHRVGILGDVVVAQSHIGSLAFLVRNRDGNDAATKVGDAHFHVALVLQHKETNGLLIDGGIEAGSIKAGRGETAGLRARARRQSHKRCSEHGNYCCKKMFFHRFLICLVY